MELLLNLCCFLLFGPAIYLWLRRRRDAASVLQFSIALICLLFLLFPVISATDDLHAMRQEMEESGPSKRTLRQAGKSASGQDFSAPAVELPSVAKVLPSLLPCGSVLGVEAAAPVCSKSAAPVSRAPPSFLLA